MLPLDDAEADRLLGGVPPERRGECWWFVLRDGTPVAGDDGGPIAVLATLRTTRLLGVVLRGARLGGALDALDRIVARHRGRLGRIVPDGPAPRRYP